MKIESKNMILVLIIVSYIVRLAIAPFHIMVPHIPHDLYSYIGPGKCMAEGKFPFMDCLSWIKQTNQFAVYGPVLSVIFAFAYIFLGQYDFFMYKVIVILFDVANTFLVYLLTKRLLNNKKAIYVSLLYSLSFTPLINSAVFGNDETILLFFMLLSTHFLVKKKFASSAAVYSLSFLLKPISVVIAPAILLYIYKKHGFKTSLKYMAAGGICLAAVFSIFVLLGGFDGVTYYINAGSVGLEGGYSSNLSAFNIFKYLTNINAGLLATPVMILSLAFTVLLIINFQMKNAELELFRNVTLLIAVILLTGNVLSGIYVILFLPFLLIFLAYGKQDVKLDWKKFIGFAAIFVGLIIYSAIYREGLVSYSTTDRILLLFALLAVTAGEFQLMGYFGKNFAFVFAAIAFSSLMFLEVYAAPLLVFPLKYFSNFINIERFAIVNKMYGEHIMGRPDLLLAYGTFYAVPAFILLLSLAFICVKLLRTRSK